MNDPAPLSADSGPLNLSVDTQATLALEKRVQCLEDDVKVLKDTTSLEERVVERVTDHLRKTTLADKFSAGPARGALPTSLKDGPAARGRYTWLFFDMASEARLLLVMLFDRRYALAWTTHMVVWLFIPAILT